MRTFGRSSVVPLLSLALLVAGVAHAEAQRGPQRRGPDPQSRERLMRQVRERFGQMIREELDLTSDQAQSLGEVVRSFDERRGALAREDQALRRRVEALVLEGGSDQEEAGVLLARMSELRAEEAQLFAEEQEALSGVLEPVQVLRFLTLRERMAQRIRALRGGGPGRGGPPGKGSATWMPLGLGPV